MNHHMNNRVLVIDGDVATQQQIVATLEPSGFMVEITGEIHEALKRLNFIKPDLIILEPDLPNNDGSFICQHLRTLSNIPIIVISGFDTEHDRLKWIDLGADLCLEKPLRLNELKARIKALIRLAYGNKASPPAAPTILTYQDLTINLEQHTIKLADEYIDLTPTEYNLLVHLLKNQGLVLPREHLLNHVWGPEYIDNVDTLRHYISKLRQKLKDNPESSKFIISVRGIGYKLGE
jgi:two-component system KDP operon response regulator KdpE